MKRNAMFIALAMVSLLANAETITGRYSSNLPFKKGEISISNKRTGKSTQLDKKGRFALRNVDIDHDTLVLFAANRNRTTFLPAKGCVEFIIKEEDDKVDVLQKRMVQEPAGEHGGQIYLKESLEKTGESMTLAAVNTRVPRSTVYTTFTGNTEPVTESNGRIHTSTATVLAIPEAEESDFELNLDEVRVDIFHSSGAGILCTL